MRALGVFAGIALLISGCVGSSADDGKAADVAQPSAAFDETTGGLQGIVTDEQLAPVAGALVGLVDRNVQATTDEQGRFQFSSLEPGRAQLQVQAFGYQSAVQSIDIVAGQVVDANLALVVIPIVEPYEVTVLKSGKIFCGIAYRTPVPQASGVFAACGAVYNTPLSTLDSFVVPFEVSSGNISQVAALVFETQWTASQAFGSGLRIGWEAYQEITPAYTFTEPLRTFATARGPNPLWAIADAATIADNVTAKDPAPKYCAADGPCKFWGRAFPHASTLGSSSPVDFATYIDQTYTHYVTEFYGLPPPEGFSALADS